MEENILETFILVLMVNGLKSHGRNLISWKLFIRGIIAQIIMIVVNGVKCWTSLWFWENKGCITEIIPYGWFQWYFRYWLSRRSKDDKRQINRWLKIVSRFRGKLVSKDAGSKFDDYSISPEIRQILLHWDFEFTKKDFLLT